MLRFPLGLLALFLCPIVFAETVTVRWSPVTERENGSPVENVSYEIWYNNEPIQSQPGTEYSMDLGPGAHSLQVFAVEDGMRSTPSTFTFEIRRFPPKAPSPL